MKDYLERNAFIPRTTKRGERFPFFQSAACGKKSGPSMPLYPHRFTSTSLSWYSEALRDFRKAPTVTDFLNVMIALLYLQNIPLKSEFLSSRDVLSFQRLILPQIWSVDSFLERMRKQEWRIGRTMFSSMPMLFRVLMEEMNILNGKKLWYIVSSNSFMEVGLWK